MTEAQVHIEQTQGATVVRVIGEIDVTNTAGLAEQFRVAADARSGSVVLDLTAVHYLDSAGIRVLFDLAGSLETARQSLAIVAPEGSPLRRLFTITRIGDVARLVASLDEALPKQTSSNP